MSNCMHTFAPHLLNTKLVDKVFQENESVGILPKFHRWIIGTITENRNTGLLLLWLLLLSSLLQNTFAGQLFAG